MTLADEARAAHAAARAEQATAAAGERKALRQAATDAVRAVLTRPDGTTLRMTEAGLTPVHADVKNGLVVWTAGAVSLAAHRRPVDGTVRWVVRLVEQVDGKWTWRSEGLRSLADLGAALAGER